MIGPLVISAIAFLVVLYAFKSQDEKNLKKKRQEKVLEEATEEVWKLSKSVEDLTRRITGLEEKNQLLVLSHEEVKKKAELAEYIAHSAKMDLAKARLGEKLRIQLEPVKLYHIRARIKEQKKLSEGLHSQKADKKLINKIKTDLNDLSQ